MANISDTTGTVTIVADTKDDLLKILSIISREQSNYWYATNYLGDLTSDDIWFDKMEQKFRATIDFAAEGRWTYQCNLENFGAWLDSSLSEIDKNEDKIYLESLN